MSILYIGQICFIILLLHIPNTKPFIKTSFGTIVTEGDGHVFDYDKEPAESTYYTKGHIERDGEPVTITGIVYSGGDTFLIPQWVKTCD